MSRISGNGAVECGKVTDSVIDGVIVNGDRISYYGNGRLYAYNPSAGERLIASLPAGMEKDKVGFADNGKGYVWLLSREGVASCHIDVDGRAEISTGRFKPSGMSVTKACSLTASADGRRLYCINHTRLPTATAILKDITATIFRPRLHVWTWRMIIQWTSPHILWRRCPISRHRSRTVMALPFCCDFRG